MPVITGTDAGEQLIGTTGGDEIDALGGDDHIAGKGGDDVVDGGAGADTAYFSSTGLQVTVTRSGDATVLTEAGVQSLTARNVERFAIVPDALTGAGLLVDASQADLPITFSLSDFYADTILGSSAADVFVRMSGLGAADTLTGSGGSDRYEFYNDFSALRGTTILDFDFDDTIHVMPMAPATYVGSASLTAPGEYRSYTSGGQTFVVGDGGATVLTLAGAFNLEETAPGSNVLRIVAQLGTEGDDVIQGGPLDERIHALGGADSLNGGAGDDTLDGGDGDDRLDGGVGHDTIDGGDGIDVLVIDWSDSDASVDADELAGWTNAASEGFYVSADRSVTFSDIESVDITLGSGSNRLLVAGGVVRGGDGADHVTAWGGPLEFYGGGWQDIFYSGSGADFFDGGGSDLDIIDFAYADAGITASLGAQPGDTGTASDGDTFVNVERLYGSTFDDTLHGSDVADILSGNQGDDTIHGQGGEDRIGGSSGSDVLYGGAGNDIMTGEEGTDAVYGEAGDDILRHDEISNGDIYDGGAGFDILALAPHSIVPPDGTAVYSLFSATLASIERIRLDSGPYAGVHVLLGPDQVAAAGLTEIVGGAGRDALTLIVSGVPGANVTATMPEFTITDWDSSPTPHITGTVVDYLELAGSMLVGQPSPNYTLHAREGLGVTQTLSGASGNDTLVGSSGTEYLFAFGGGADLLQGAGGNDVLVASNSNFLGTVTASTWAGAMFDGGGGTDIFSVGGVVNFAGQLAAIEHIYLQPPVTTAEPDGSGSQAAAHLTLTATQMAALDPGLALSGTGTLTVTLAPGDSYDASGHVIAAGSSITHLVNGSTGNETIVGLAAADSLSGGDGNDTLDGGGGIDTLDGGDGIDTLDGGVDTDALDGGSGDDTLDGGQGADTMAGGLGDDVFIVDDSGDVVIEDPGGGSDTIYVYAPYVLPAGIETVYLGIG